MFSEKFNSLPDIEKHQLIYDAEKLDELSDGFTRFALYKLGDLFIEVKSSPDRVYRKSIQAFELKDIPLIYSSCIICRLGAM
ncbi:hypothetical protein [Aridibaculum aurantiacum]|uniref:hypothetical protein n=1 Tax=Aridibaculum aurantiacum TaxID=2810307 RepID=UPI001A961701|nr:hypothetical protein [Aridibaculum aurantiacum]